MPYTKLLSLLVVTMLTVSCKNVVNKSKNDGEANDTTDLFNPSFVYRLTTSSPIFEFDSMANMPAYQKWYSGIDSINFDDSSETDTLVTLVRGADTLLFAKANSGMFLWKMKLSSNKIVLDTNISVSCKKSVFFSKLGLSSLARNVLIWGDGAGETFQFVFNLDTLTEILYEMHFEAMN